MSAPMEVATLGFAFAAGLLSILSPCVLPLVPVVVGTAFSRHRLGPAALAAGLAVSYVAIGLFVATIGLAVGLDADLFRTVGAVLLMAAGAVLLLSPLQLAVSRTAAPIAAWMDALLAGLPSTGPGGQFLVGIFLGIVWSPCVGPTLGAASVMAAQGQDLAQAATVMLLFAAGTVLPLLMLGYASREAFVRWRGRLLSTGKTGKILLGIVLLATGFLVLSGLDRMMEVALLTIAPPWLTWLATRF